MAFVPFGAGRIDKLLDIIFTKQVTYVGAKTFPMWDMIKSKKASDPLARAVRYRVLTELGFPAAGAGRDPGAASYAFPRAFLANLNEYEGEYKLKATTVGLSFDLYRQAQLAKSAKALEPLALEMTSKAIAESRIMACEFWLDGSGVRGTAASADDTNLNTATATLPTYLFPYMTFVQLSDLDGDRGHANCFEYGDIVAAYSQTGTVITPTGLTAGTAPGQFYGWKVADRDRRAQTVALQPVDTTLTILAGATASNIVATTVFYRVDGQTTFPNLTTPGQDYGSMTEIMAGLESLAANDGRIVFGMNMSGITARSDFNAQTQPLDALMVDEALGEAKNRMGEGRFPYKQMIMDDFSHRQLIDSRETDRRFISYQDNVRGTSYIGYQHRSDIVRAVVDEYVRRRIWMLPEEITGEKILEYHGTDWENVSLPKGGSMFFNPTTDGRYTNQMVSFKSQRGVLIDRVPGAIACVHNYTLSV